MSDIPEDIDRTATLVHVEMSFHVDNATRIEQIAAAILAERLAERERCASIASAWHCHDDDDILEPEYACGRNVTAQTIAEQIRAQP